MTNRKPQNGRQLELQYRNRLKQEQDKLLSQWQDKIISYEECNERYTNLPKSIADELGI